MNRPALSPKQLQVVTMPMPRMLVLVGVTGSGKSFAANLREYAEICMLDPGQIYLLTGNNRLSVRKNVVTELLKLDDGVGFLDYREHVGRICTRRGGEVLIVGMNDEGAQKRLQGGSVCRWYADEPTTYPRSAWDMALTRCRGVVDGALAVSPIIMTLNPDDEDHFIKTTVVDRAEELGAVVFNFGFADNPMANDKFVNEMSGMFTGAFYDRMIRGVWSSGSADRAIPEWDSEKYVQSVQIPRFFNWYGALDPGYSDGAGYLAALYDFINARIVILGEVVANRCNSAVLSEAIKQCEAAILTQPKMPKLRVSDTSLQVIADLSKLHGLQFVPARKDDKAAAVNALRVMIGQGRVVIADNAVSVRVSDDREIEVTRGGAVCTVGQLRRCRWDKNRNGWQRSDIDGHFELVDCLVYMSRHIDYNTNPAPAFGGRVESDNFIVTRKDIKSVGMAAILNNAKKLSTR